MYNLQIKKKSQNSKVSTDDPNEAYQFLPFIYSIFTFFLPKKLKVAIIPVYLPISGAITFFFNKAGY